MSKRSTLYFLLDIYVAITKIEHIVERYDNAQRLLHDFMAWDSVIREFEIVGEASNRLLRMEELEERHRVVVDFRNIIIHHYFGIDADEVWEVATQHLQTFKHIIVEKLLTEESDALLAAIEDFRRQNDYLPFAIAALDRFKEKLLKKG